jgi:omega-6 fatty acid desaturase (delta-12 desaturase)
LDRLLRQSHRPTHNNQVKKIMNNLTQTNQESILTKDFSLSSWLTPEQRKQLLQRSNLKALTLFLSIIIGYCLCITGTFLNLGIYINLIFSIIAGIVLAQIFIIAHETIHYSYAETKWQNELISGICFFLTLHSRILYKVIHINFHHKYINVKELDPNWNPLEKQEFDKLPWHSKLTYKLYRSSIGTLIYYVTDLWFKCYFFSIHPLINSDRKKYVLSSFAVIFAAIGQCIFFYQLGQTITSNRSIFEILFLSWLFPISICFWFISFTFYMQHTNPKIPWLCLEKFENIDFYNVVIRSCNRMHFPEPIESMYLDECEHTAHHLLAGIPLYNQKKAQRLFEDAHRGRTIVIKNGFLEFFKVTRICKLYDFDRNCWTDFNGIPTSIIHNLSNYKI